MAGRAKEPYVQRIHVNVSHHVPDAQEGTYWDISTSVETLDEAITTAKRILSEMKEG